MLPFDQGETLADEEVERRLRFSVVDCVDPGSIDQADLHAFSQGPVAAEVAQRAREHLDRCEYCRALSSEYRRLAHERRRKKRTRAVATTGSIAAAAAVAAVVLLLPRSAILRAYEPAELRGAAATTMATPTVPRPMPQEPWRFASTSPIELTLRPREEEAQGLVPKLGVFLAERGGVLVRVYGVHTKTGDDPGFPVLHISATGAELYGEQTGARDLILVLAPDAKTLEAIAGKSYEEARATARGAQFMSFETIYEK